MIVFVATLILGMVFLIMIKATHTMAAVKTSEEAKKYYSRIECLGVLHESEFPTNHQHINSLRDIS